MLLEDVVVDRGNSTCILTHFFLPPPAAPFAAVELAAATPTDLEDWEFEVLLVEVEKAPFAAAAASCLFLAAAASEPFDEFSAAVEANFDPPDVVLCTETFKLVWYLKGKWSELWAVWKTIWKQPP